MEEQANIQQRLLRDVWGLKRETVQLVSKAHAKHTLVISPMEALGIKDSVEDIRAVMSDGCHLNGPCVDMVVDHMVKKVEEFFVSKKRGPTERAGPVEKRGRFESEGGASGSGWYGSRGSAERGGSGRGGGGRGGGGRGGNRTGSWGGFQRTRQYY